MKLKSPFILLIAATTLSAFADDTIKPTFVWSGLGQVHARLFNDQNGPAAETKSTLLLRRAELKVTATITPRINGWIMIDPAKQLSANANGVTQSSNILQELVVSYKVAEKTFFDIGQYKVHIGYEGDLLSAGATPNIERSLIYQARDPLGGGNGDVRDTGARVRGSIKKFDYWAGIYNGLGDRQNTTASADDKIYAGRLLLNAVKGLQVGVSGGSASGDTGLHRRIINAFVVYKHDRVTLQSEYTSGENKFDFRGYYAHAGWTFTPRWEGTLRYDTYDFDRRRSGGDSTVTDSIVGVNYLLAGKNARIQANLIHRNGGSDLTAANGFWTNATTFANDRNELRLNFQVAF